MVEPRRVLEVVRATLEGMVPDGRYALDGVGFAPSWVLSPDYEQEFTPRDLLAQVLLGGPAVQGQALVYPLSIQIVLAHYSGERTSLSSGVPVTSYERVHGAALHLMEALPRAPIPGCTVAPLGYSQPLPSEPPDFVACDVLFTLIASPR